MSMNNAAINGLCLDERALARANSGFQVVSVHQGCTQHNGLFFEAALAAEYAASLTAGAAAEGNPNRYVVKAWKKASRRR